MNDNDIIKALEFCESPDCECTRECPMFCNGIKSISDCRGELHKNALDLINRQKAEIERLEDMVAQNEGVLPKYEQLIKAEAIKEFEDRLKEKAFYVQESEWDGYVVDCNDVIGVAKEMTEDKDGNV